VGKFVTRRRRGDAALQADILAEARRLYESGAGLSEAICRLLVMAGDNPNAFNCFSIGISRQLNRTSEGRAIMRLVGTASLDRDSPDPSRGWGNGWWPSGD
jgi:hypothetical protein